MAHAKVFVCMKTFWCLGIDLRIISTSGHTVCEKELLEHSYTYYPSVHLVLVTQLCTVVTTETRIKSVSLVGTQIIRLINEYISS